MDVPERGRPETMLIGWIVDGVEDFLKREKKFVFIWSGY